MSKAKKLATYLPKDLSNLNRIELEDRLLQLCDAVLSEPEEPCGLKGWIEVTYTAHSEIVEFIPINKYRVVNFNDRCAVIPIIDTENSSNVYMVKESYEELKRKIKEAS